MPEYMLRFTSEERDTDYKHIEDLELDVFRAEEYGDFRVGVKSSLLYVLHLEKGVYEKFSYMNLDKVAETIDVLAEGLSLEEAKSRVYNKKSYTPGNRMAADRLETFLEDGFLAETDVEALVELKDDWMPDGRELILDEMGQDLQAFKAEGFNSDEILELLSKTYTRSHATLSRDLRELGFRPENL